MSDLEEELLGLAEDDPHRRRHKKKSGGKSQAYVDSDDEGEGEEEMDMDLDESDDDDEPAPKGVRSGSGKNPYPLEGKYIDEDDREMLEGMPEIERENILASRLEEMQKFKDSMQLDMMYKMAGMDEDDDDEPSRKRRKHTSVSKEASRAMKDLKNKRKALDERAQRRALRRERRHSPTSDSHSTEDGEISRYETAPRHRPRRSESRSPVRKQAGEGSKKVDLDASPPTCIELNSARLSRYEIVDMMFKDGFEDLLEGAYVRLAAGEIDRDSGRPKYRIQKVLGLEEGRGKYDIEYQGRNIPETRGMLCQYGSLKRLFRIADVSNGDFEETEFRRWAMTSEMDKVKMPKRSDLKDKHEHIKALRDRPMTNEEITRQVEARKQANPLAQRTKAIVEISQLYSSRNLALRRNDKAVADDLARQIVNLGGDPNTGQLAAMSKPASKTTAKEDHDERIQRINENNKRRTKEAMAAAHLVSLQKKKAEEAFLQAQKENSNSPLPVEKVAVPPASGLKKGETPQQYVARTIDLDLGDF